MGSWRNSGCRMAPSLHRGFPQPGYPLESLKRATYQCNVNPFDSNPSIGAGDLALLVTQLGTSCQLSKPSGGDEVAAILDWFGIAATGRAVVAGPRGETLPEYDFVSVEKAQRASADPYGYRKNLNSAAVKEVPWGIIKQLYR